MKSQEGTAIVCLRAESLTHHKKMKKINSIIAAPLLGVAMYAPPKANSTTYNRIFLLPNANTPAATYSQVLRCREVPAKAARQEYYGYIAAAGETVHLSQSFQAEGPKPDCRYETDYDKREITEPSDFYRL